MCVYGCLDHACVGVEILNHCIKPPMTGREYLDSNSMKLLVQNSTMHMAM